MKNSNNTNGKSIMDFPFNELMDTCKIFLLRFDDYQQACADKGNKQMAQFFDDSFNQLEAIIFNLKAEELTDKVRNQIRSLIKHTEEMPVVQFCK